LTFLKCTTSSFKCTTPFSSELYWHSYKSKGNCSFLALKIPIYLSSISIHTHLKTSALLWHLENPIPKLCQHYYIPKKFQVFFWHLKTPTFSVLKATLISLYNHFKLYLSNFLTPSKENANIQASSLL
jgi:hypothetical protein